MIRLFPALALLALLFSACGSSKELQYDEDGNPIYTRLVEFQRGACYGECPVYTLTVYNEGLAKFNGKKFTDKTGIHTKQLSKAQVSELRTFLEKAKLFDYPDSYGEGIVDAQLTTLTYYSENDGPVKRISGKDDRPEALKAIDARMEELVNSAGWESLKDTRYGLPSGYIANEIIVQLKPETDAATVAERFASKEMKVVRTVSAPTHMYLVTYNPERMKPEAMLAELKAQPEVLNAEFNKQLGMRR